MAAEESNNWVARSAAQDQPAAMTPAAPPAAPQQHGGPPGAVRAGRGRSIALQYRVTGARSTGVGSRWTNPRGGIDAAPGRPGPSQHAPASLSSSCAATFDEAAVVRLERWPTTPRSPTRRTRSTWSSPPGPLMVSAGTTRWSLAGFFRRPHRPPPLHDVTDRPVLSFSPLPSRPSAAAGHGSSGPARDDASVAKRRKVTNWSPYPARAPWPAPGGVPTPSPRHGRPPLRAASTRPGRHLVGQGERQQPRPAPTPADVAELSLRSASPPPAHHQASSRTPRSRAPTAARRTAVSAPPPFWWSAAAAHEEPRRRKGPFLGSRSPTGLTGGLRDDRVRVLDTATSRATGPTPTATPTA